MNAATILAIDGGQSGFRMRLRGPDGCRTATVSGFAYGAEDPVHALSDLIAEAWQKLHGGGVPTPESVGIGLTGELDPAQAERLADRAADLTGARNVRVAHDSLTAHLGALDGQPGIVAAVGTGTVVLAIDKDGHHHRVDGWGHLLGDAGSGFAIGRAGLRAAAGAFDGRGPATALTTMAKARYGPLSQLPQRLYRSPSLVADVAAFTPDVADAARERDQVAGQIWADAVDNLTRAVRAAAKACPSAHRVSYAGSVLTAHDLLLTPWIEKLTSTGLDVAAPVGDALQGAELLATATDTRRWRTLLWADSTDPKRMANSERDSDP